MDDKKLLTISIPTWNRANLLNTLLEELTAQIISQDLQGMVEILISNNGSDDDTHEVVEKFKNSYPFIMYNRNPSNIGGKLNVLKVMELVRTDYLIYCGDDDKLNIKNLKSAIEFIKSKNDLGVLLDSYHSKFKYTEKIEAIDAEELVKNFFWYVGNAGCFIVKADYIKTYVAKFGYDFFNECWAQTQLMILGLQNSNERCYVGNWNLPSESVHDEVMIYTSFYLWRTCYYELLLSINGLRNETSPKVYNAGRIYLKKSLPQQFFNILQCGIFTDEPGMRKKTARHILNNLNMFSAYEKLVLCIMIISLSLPTLLSRPLSDIFIFILKGKKGLVKKGDFVRKELSKKDKSQKDGKSIRETEFEK